MKKLLTDLKASYVGVGRILGRYWTIYGGLRDLLLSPYLHLSLLLTILMNRFWQVEAWWNTAISIMPSILGFTLAGFTIWLGFGDEKFRQLIAKRQKKSGNSAYMGASAAFVHFIIVQLIALLAALWALATAYDLQDGNCLKPLMPYLSKVGHFIGFFLFVYALLTILAATAVVFRAAFWYETHRSSEKAALLKCSRKRR